MVIINSFVQPESPIRLEQRNLRAVLDKKDLGLGTLYISESNLCWNEREDIGFSLEYGDITLHAISRDQTVYPGECIYILIDGRLEMPGTQRSTNTENEDDSDDECVSELVLVPENPMVLSVIYETLKICQELNPDPNDLEEDDDMLYVDAEDDLEDEYIINEIERNGGNGDVAINDLARRFGDNVDLEYNMSNGNEEEEFEDAD